MLPYSDEELKFINKSKENNMWNNFNMFDLFDYKKTKENYVELNNKIMNFWKDFYNDVFSTIKKDI